MPRLALTKYIVPQFSFRYAVKIKELKSFADGANDDTSLLYAKSLSLPKLSHDAIELSAPTYTYAIAGKARREAVTLSVYTYNSVTMAELLHWVSLHHGTIKGSKQYARDEPQEFVVTRNEVQPESYGTDGEQPGWYDDYCLKEIVIQLLREDSLATDEIVLQKVWIETLDLGEVDYEGDAILTATMTLRYERLFTRKQPSLIDEPEDTPPPPPAISF